MSIFNPHPDDENEIWSYKKYLTHSLWRFQNIGKSKKAELTNDYDRLTLKFKVNRDQLDSYKQVLYVSTSIDDFSRILLIGRGASEDIFSSVTKKNPAEVSFQPAWVFIQSNSKKKIPLRTQNLEGKLPGLCDYLDYDVLDYDYENSKFKNKTINELTLELDGGDEIKLCTRLIVDATSDFKANIDSYIDIRSKNDVSVLTKIETFDKVEEFFNFIFASQFKNKIFKITEWEKRRKKHNEIHMILPLKQLTNDRKDGRFYNTVLFTKKDLPDTNSANAIANWIENYELFGEIPEVIKLLKSNKLSEELRFTLLINALEATHRKNFNRLKNDKATFRQQRNRILDEISEQEDKDLVSFHLNWANEIHLIERLEDINNIVSYYGVEPLTEPELKKIKNTRNYLVHKDQALKSKAYTNTDLYFINNFLANGLKVLVLNFLNFTRDEILHIVESSKQLDSFYRDEPASDKASRLLV